MTHFNYDTQETWDALYNPPFVRENRELIFGEGMRDTHILRIELEKLGMKNTDSILFVGGAYGWTAEAWMQHGYNQVAVCDISSYIQSNKSNNAVLDILNESSMTEISRTNVKSYLGVSTIEWIITEDIIVGLTDSDVSMLSTELRKYGGTVVHWTTGLAPNNPYGLNLKAIENWKTLLAPDLIVERGTSRII
jgi:hypothetical protein